jgi:hypothetical protein
MSGDCGCDCSGVDSDGGGTEDPEGVGAGKIIAIVFGLIIVVGLIVKGLQALLDSSDAGDANAWSNVTLRSCERSQAASHNGQWLDCAEALPDAHAPYQIRLTLQGFAPNSWSELGCHAAYEDPIAQTGPIAMQDQVLDGGTGVQLTAQAKSFGADQSAHVVKFGLQCGRKTRTIDTRYTISASF